MRRRVRDQGSAKPEPAWPVYCDHCGHEFPGELDENGLCWRCAWGVETNVKNLGVLETQMTEAVTE